MNDLLGKYLNGYKIVKIEADPFIKGQINLWTDSEEIGTFGDRSITKFFVRDEGNSDRIYQELVDKEKYELQQENNQLKEQRQELRSWLEESKKIAVAQEHIGSINAINLVLDKLNELEGGKNE